MCICVFADRDSLSTGRRFYYYYYYLLIRVFRLISLYVVFGYALLVPS